MSGNIEKGTWLKKGFPPNDRSWKRDNASTTHWSVTYYSRNGRGGGGRVYHSLIVPPSPPSRSLEAEESMVIWLKQCEFLSVNLIMIFPAGNKISQATEKPQIIWGIFFSFFLGLMVVFSGKIFHAFGKFLGCALKGGRGGNKRVMVMLDFPYEYWRYSLCAM